jgi:hypothetical protein
MIKGREMANIRQGGSDVSASDKRFVSEMTY